MSRPAQLEQQIARVKEIETQLSEADKPVVPAKEPVEPAPADEKVVEPATTVVTDESPVTISKDEYNKLEQRYRTLQGMHAADGQRFRAETASLQAALQDLEDRLVAAEKKTTSVAPTPTRYVTEEDEREYGDTLEMVRRAAREEAEATAAKRDGAYLERIAQLESKLGHVQNTVVPAVENLTRDQVEQVKQNFWATISTEVPDWRTINDNADFKAWLLAEDPITGATRQQFLSQARNDYNAPRVVRFFQEWKRSAAGGQTPAPKTNAQTELENLVAPGASKGAGVTTQPEKKQWTGADISQFYRDVNIGKYADKPDMRKKIEDDIFLAQKEGRVTQS